MATQKKVPGKAVATRAEETTAVAAPLDADLLRQDAASDPAFQRDDLAIPFLKVLQKASPEVNKRDAAYVKGAEPGDLFNTVTSSLYKGEAGAVVVPVHYEPSYVEWRPLEQGGGFVKDHGTDDSLMASCVRDAKGRDITPAGNQLVRSALYYVFLVDPETGASEQAAFSLKSTQLKKARKWNSLMAALRVTLDSGEEIKPAMFYQAYRVSTVPESNDQGDWMGVKMASECPTLQLPRGRELYLAAREFRALVQSGTVKAVPPQQADEVVDDDAY